MKKILNLLLIIILLGIGGNEMTVKAIPFDVVLYSSEDWREVWGSTFMGKGNRGVVKGYEDSYEVTAPGTGMIVQVGKGSSIVEGAWVHNDASTNVTISGGLVGADERIDTIVVKLTFGSKSAEITVHEGLADPNPIPPTLQQDATVWEIPLANVHTTPSTAVITSSELTDAREWCLHTMGQMVYDAIVDVNGNGDYLLPSQAFSAGAKTVYVRNGVYTEVAGFTIPNNGALIGESKNGAIIDLPSGTTVLGESVPVSSNTGTISLTNGSTTVTGSGTAWSTSDEDKVLITEYGDVLWVDTYVGGTQLTLLAPYEGASISSVNYMIADMKRVTIRDITIRKNNCTSSYPIIALSTHYGSNIENTRLVYARSASAIYIRDSYDCIMRDLDILIWDNWGATSGSIGIKLFGGYMHTIENCRMSGGDYGIYVNSCPASSIVNNIITEFSEDGIYIDSSGDTVISNNTISVVNNYGINIIAGTRLKITGNLIRECGDDGITGVISLSSIVGNHIVKCAGEGLQFDSSSASTTVVGNDIYENGNGIFIHSAAGTIVMNGNRISGNIGIGVDINGDYNILVANLITGNSGGNVDDTGTANEIAHNI